MLPYDIGTSYGVVCDTVRDDVVGYEGQCRTVSCRVCGMTYGTVRCGAVRYGVVYGVVWCNRRYSTRIVVMANQQ